MPLYTLKKLISDCSSKTWKTRHMPKGIPERERVQIYEEIWMALNLWLRATMEQGKGGHIPSFGTFCWELEVVQHGHGEKIKRKTPTFVLDKIMTSEFSAKPWKRPVSHRRLTKPLEMNFVELAIRWSAILTKDLVFSGLRDMLARLRVVIKRGYKLKVRFGMGKLLVKERRVAFSFDPELRISKNKKLASFQTLPNSMTVAADSEIGDLIGEASEGGSSFAPTARRTPEGGRLTPLNKSKSAPVFVGMNGTPRTSRTPRTPRTVREQQNPTATSSSPVPNLDLSEANLNTIRPEEDHESESIGIPLSNQPTFRSEQGDDNNNNNNNPSLSSTQRDAAQAKDITAFNADRSCVFAVSEKYRGGANPDRLDRKAMREALALAYERHLIDVEADIAVEEEQADHWRYQLWERELQYRKDAERKQNDLAELDGFLVEQIKIQKQRLKEDDTNNRGTNERGRAYPNFRRLKRLAKIYGVYKDKEGRFVQNTIMRDDEKMSLTNRSEDDTDFGGLGGVDGDPSTGAETERRIRQEATELGLALRHQIERRMSEMNNKRRSELEEGRTFIEQINWDSKRMLALKMKEHERTQLDLKEAWDRDTHVKNVLKLRRKMLKRGGFIFQKKPPTPAEAMDRLAPKEAYERRENGKDGAAPRNKGIRGKQNKMENSKSTTARSNQVANPDYISQTKNGMEKVNLTATQTMMVPVLHDTIISSYLTESKKEKKPDISVGYDMRSAR